MVYTTLLVNLLWHHPQEDQVSHHRDLLTHLKHERDRLRGDNQRLKQQVRFPICYNSAHTPCICARLR